MSEPNRLTHADEHGRVHMVDISEKPTTTRVAVASGRVRMSEAAALALRDVSSKKGDVVATVRIAAIAAAKRTADLIPLCHQVALSACSLEVGDAVAEGDGFVVDLRARAVARDATGVEMEALTAVSIAALTMVDMLKAVDRGLVIERISLESKHGGQRGGYQKEASDQ